MVSQLCRGPRGRDGLVGDESCEEPRDRHKAEAEDALHQVLLDAASALLTSAIRRRSISAISSALTLRILPPCASFSKSALTTNRVTLAGSAWMAITYWLRKPETSSDVGLETLRSVTYTAFWSVLMLTLSK